MRSEAGEAGEWIGMAGPTVDSPNAFSQMPYIEIEKKSDLEVRVLKVRQHLGNVDRLEPVDGLELEQYATLDDEVRPIGARHDNFVEHYRNGHFRVDLQPFPRQTVPHTNPIGALEEAGTHLRVNIEGARKDPFSQVLGGFHTFLNALTPNPMTFTPSASPASLFTS